MEPTKRWRSSWCFTKVIWWRAWGYGVQQITIVHAWSWLATHPLRFALVWGWMEQTILWRWVYGPMICKKILMHNPFLQGLWLLQGNETSAICVLQVRKTVDLRMHQPQENFNIVKQFYRTKGWYSNLPPWAKIYIHGAVAVVSLASKTLLWPIFQICQQFCFCYLELSTLLDYSSPLTQQPNRSQLG